jgi:hypothetical protein
MKKTTTTRKASAPASKAKTVKKMQDGGKTPTPAKKTYKTATGAQQYIKGDTRDKRSNTIRNAKESVLRAPKYNTELYSRLSAADSADAAKNFRSFGPIGKSTTKLYDKFERQDVARAKDAKKRREDRR